MTSPAVWLHLKLSRLSWWCHFLGEVLCVVCEVIHTAVPSPIHLLDFYNLAFLAVVMELTGFGCSLLSMLKVSVFSYELNLFDIVLWDIGHP